MILANGFTLKRIKRTTTSLILIALLCPLSTSSIASAETFPSTHSDKISGLNLQRCGTATLRAYAIFKVGESALYRQNCKSEWKLESKEARHMVFKYKREIPGHAFSESAEEILKRNMDLSPYAAELATFHSAYQAVDDGDVYKLTYIPDQGLKLYLNDTLLGELKQEPIAHLYFAIWLGSAPFDDDLKEDLLGRSQ